MVLLREQLNIALNCLTAVSFPCFVNNIIGGARVIKDFPIFTCCYPCCTVPCHAPCGTAVSEGSRYGIGMMGWFPGMPAPPPEGK